MCNILKKIQGMYKAFLHGVVYVSCVGLLCYTSSTLAITAMASAELNGLLAHIKSSNIQTKEERTKFRTRAQALARKYPNSAIIQEIEVAAEVKGIHDILNPAVTEDSLQKVQEESKQEEPKIQKQSVEEPKMAVSKPAPSSLKPVVTTASTKIAQQEPSAGAKTGLKEEQEKKGQEPEVEVSKPKVSPPIETVLAGQKVAQQVPDEVKKGAQLEEQEKKLPQIQVEVPKDLVNKIHILDGSKSSMHPDELDKEVARLQDAIGGEIAQLDLWSKVFDMGTYAQGSRLRLGKLEDADAYVEAINKQTIDNQPLSLREIGSFLTYYLGAENDVNDALLGEGSDNIACKNKAGEIRKKIDRYRDTLVSMRTKLEQEQKASENNLTTCKTTLKNSAELESILLGADPLTEVHGEQVASLRACRGSLNSDEQKKINKIDQLYTNIQRNTSRLKGYQADLDEINELISALEIDANEGRTDSIDDALQLVSDIKNNIEIIAEENSKQQPRPSVYVTNGIQSMTKAAEDMELNLLVQLEKASEVLQQGVEEFVQKVQQHPEATITVEELAEATVAVEKNISIAGKLPKKPDSEKKKKKSKENEVAVANIVKEVTTSKTESSVSPSKVSRLNLGNIASEVFQGAIREHRDREATLSPRALLSPRPGSEDVLFSPRPGVEESKPTTKPQTALQKAAARIKQQTQGTSVVVTSTKPAVTQKPNIGIIPVQKPEKQVVEQVGPAQELQDAIHKLHMQLQQDANFALEKLREAYKGINQKAKSITISADAQMQLTEIEQAVEKAIKLQTQETVVFKGIKDNFERNVSDVDRITVAKEHLMHLRTDIEKFKTSGLFANKVLFIKSVIDRIYANIEELEKKIAKELENAISKSHEKMLADSSLTLEKLAAEYKAMYQKSENMVISEDAQKQLKEIETAIERGATVLTWKTEKLRKIEDDFARNPSNTNAKKDLANLRTQIETFKRSANFPKQPMFIQRMVERIYIKVVIMDNPELIQAFGKGIKDLYPRCVDMLPSDIRAELDKLKKPFWEIKVGLTAESEAKEEESTKEKAEKETIQKAVLQEAETKVTSELTYIQSIMDKGIDFLFNQRLDQRIAEYEERRVQATDNVARSKLRFDLIDYQKELSKKIAEYKKHIKETRTAPGYIEQKYNAFNNVINNYIEELNKKVTKTVVSKPQSAPAGSPQSIVIKQDVLDKQISSLKKVDVASKKEIQSDAEILGTTKVNLNPESARQELEQKIHVLYESYIADSEDALGSKITEILEYGERFGIQDSQLSENHQKEWSTIQDYYTRKFITKTFDADEALKKQEAIKEVEGRIISLYGNIVITKQEDVATIGKTIKSISKDIGKIGGAQNLSAISLDKWKKIERDYTTKVDDLEKQQRANRKKVEQVQEAVKEPTPSIDDIVKYMKEFKEKLKDPKFITSKAELDAREKEFYEKDSILFGEDMQEARDTYERTHRQDASLEKISGDIQKQLEVIEKRFEAEL